MCLASSLIEADAQCIISWTKHELRLKLYEEEVSTTCESSFANSQYYIQYRSTVKKHIFEQCVDDDYKQNG